MALRKSGVTSSGMTYNVPASATVYSGFSSNLGTGRKPSSSSSSSGGGGSSTPTKATTREEFIAHLTSQQEKVTVEPTKAERRIAASTPNIIDAAMAYRTSQTYFSGSGGMSLPSGNVEFVRGVEPQLMSVPKTVQTAEQKILDSYNKSSPFSQWYQKVDYGLGGFLPGGISRDLVKAWDTEMDIEDTKLLTKAQTALQEAELIEDYSTKSFWETLGFGYPEEERAFQERMGTVSSGNLLKNIGAEIGTGAKEAVTGTSLTSWALIGATAILGILALKSK